MDTELFGEIDNRRTKPWNRGELTGAKPPLQPKHVWAIRTRLQIAGRRRDLALFNIAIDSKLRGCDVVSLKVEDVAPHGYAVDRAMIRQRKTGRPVKFEITEQTRQAIDDLLASRRSSPSDYLFGGHRRGSHLTTRQYARLLAEWLTMIGLNPRIRVCSTVVLTALSPALRNRFIHSRPENTRSLARGLQSCFITPISLCR